MSTPFINPYETKDVVNSSLNNLDKQSQDVVSYLDGLFSSETVKDKQLILDDGTVETLKPFEVANTQGAFWDKGTTYYFQPVADRLREISLELQGRLNSSEVTDSLRAGLTGLFSDTLDDSRTQISNNSTERYANTWTYERWYKDNPPIPNNPINSNNLDNFLNTVGTAAFRMADASSDELTNTRAVTNNSGIQVEVNLDGIAELLDDGDNYYNDSNTIDDPLTAINESVHDIHKQPEFYLIGNTKLPVFGAVENAPNVADAVKYPGGITNADYKKDLYNYQNKRIDPNSIYWNNPVAQKEPEEVFFDMVAIAITQQKVIGSISSADPDQVRINNNAPTAQAARSNLKSIAGNYLRDSRAWYDSPLPRNLDPAIVPKPPSFLLNKSTLEPTGGSTINYTVHDGSYGAFKATDLNTLADLVSTATGISAADFSATLDHWNWNGIDPAPAGSLPGNIHNINVDKITKYYTQSYISGSITSTFGKKDAAISTKSFFIHEALNNLEPSKNPYLQEAGDRDVIKFDQLLLNVPAGYLRSPADTANTNVSTQMMQLMDLFLEDFDISANRYVEDKRTLVDLFSGKLLRSTGENAEVQKSLFQNMRSSVGDITSQIKNSLIRGISESAESQFTLDLFNHTAVRKEDFGLSPIPAVPPDPDKHFLPSGWANNKDKYLPAMYYYNPANPTPTSGSDAANNTLNGPGNKNGLPAGFPIMDVRDFDQFFKATKLALTNHIMGYLNDNSPTGGYSLITPNNLSSLYNEMGAFLTDPTTATYPNWVDAGFAAGSQATIFGTLDLAGDKTNFSRAIQLYKSLDKIIDDMERRVSSVESSVPKIPRPISPSVTNPITGLPVTLTLESSIAGYGNKPSPKLVKSFLEMHEATNAVSADPNADSLNRISYLINTFDDYAKFSQNSTFEIIYGAEVFEADKQNYTSLNAKKPEPGPDGSMPEEKDVPKPLMAALSSSVLVTKIGQVLVNKVNDLVTKNDIVSIDNVNRGGTDIGNINIGATGLSGSKESQTYLTNILKQISSISSGSIRVDVSAVGSLISDQIETGIKTLITKTDVGESNYTRMVFIDDVTIGELIDLKDKLLNFEPTGTLLTLRNLLTGADLEGLKAKAYPTTSPAPGYLNFELTTGPLALTAAQKNLINDIRDGKFVINGANYSFNGRDFYTLTANNIVPVNVPDNLLNTLGTLAANISTMLNAASTIETPPRIVNVGADPILTEINNAKLNFATLTASPGTSVAYNAILEADVYDPPNPTVSMASLLRTDAEGGNAVDRAKANTIIQARKDLLGGSNTNTGILQANNKEIGGVLINNLNKYLPTPPNPPNTPNTANPYYRLLFPITYSTLDPDNAAYANVPSTPPRKFPSALGQIDSASNFRGFLSNTKTFLANLNTNLNNASNEPTFPRSTDPLTDPILKLAKDAYLDLDALVLPGNALWNPPNNAVLTPIQATAVLNLIIASDRKIADGGALPPIGDPIGDAIRTKRTQLLGFFLENKLLDTAALAGPNNYKITDIKTHPRYANLITPATYTYPPDTDANINNPAITRLDDLTESTAPLALASTVDNSRADSFTLREIMGCDKDFTNDDVAFRGANGRYLNSINPDTPNTDIGFPNSLNDLEVQMRAMTDIDFAGAKGKTAKQLYVRKMQHFNVLFNTLSGGTTKNPSLATFGTPPGTAPKLFGGGTQNLKQYIESLASDTGPNSIINSPEFENIVASVSQLAPITENINALEVSLASEIKKPKTGPESEVYATLHLFTQIENQTPTAGDFEAGLLQIFNKRRIKTDTGIIDLMHRPVSVPKDGLYQFSGYAENLQYLDPTNPLSISGPNIAPATTGNLGWNIRALLTSKTNAFPPFTTLTQTREFLVALNEVYKDMQASKSPVIKQQLKVFDLWLKNNSFSVIGDGALGGKDSLEADINILDHIEEGSASAAPADINDFLADSRTKLLINKSKLENLNDLRTAGKGFGQRIDENLSASALEDYLHWNVFYPSGLAFPKPGNNPIVNDTRVDFTKDYFGRTLDNSNLPVFGVNIFGQDPDSRTTYTVPPDIQVNYGNANSVNPYTAPAVPPAPAIPSAIGSKSYKNFGLTGLPTLENPYEKIMGNIHTLLTALKAAETATLPRPKEKNLYKMMIKNLLGESSEVPDATLIAAALAENANCITPGHASLVDTGILTYTNNLPTVNLRSEIITERRSIGDAINPAKYTGATPIDPDILANFALSSKADQPTLMRSIGVDGKSIQELAILLYVMQMFEQSNWDWEKYINDSSRYEMVAAVE